MNRISYRNGFRDTREDLNMTELESEHYMKDQSVARRRV